MRAAIMGVSVRATQSEKSVEKTTVIANGLKSWPMRPPENAIGMKTPRFVAVEERIATAISFVPIRAASAGECPRSSNREMFSMIRIELFTRTPVEIASPSVVIMFIVYPATYIGMKVATMPTGIATEIRIVDESFRRNR